MQKDKYPQITNIDRDSVDFLFSPEMKGFYDLHTRTTYVSCDDIVKKMGLANSFTEFMSSNAGLDMLSIWKEQNPEKTMEEHMTLVNFINAIKKQRNGSHE